MGFWTANWRRAFSGRAAGVSSVTTSRVYAQRYAGHSSTSRKKLKLVRPLRAPGNRHEHSIRLPWLHARCAGVHPLHTGETSLRCPVSLCRSLRWLAALDKLVHKAGPYPSHPTLLQRQLQHRESRISTAESACSIEQSPWERMPPCNEPTSAVGRQVSEPGAMLVAQPLRRDPKHHPGRSDLGPLHA